MPIVRNVFVLHLNQLTIYVYAMDKYETEYFWLTFFKTHEVWYNG